MLCRVVEVRQDCHANRDFLPVIKINERDYIVAAGQREFPAC